MNGRQLSPEEQEKIFKDTMDGVQRSVDNVRENVQTTLNNVQRTVNGIHANINGYLAGALPNFGPRGRWS